MIRPNPLVRVQRLRQVRDGVGRGSWNMAVDVALARGLREGEAVLRTYGWSEPTLSFGRNQRARDRYEPSALAGAGIATVRRPTGGREVLHDRELTYSVVLPMRSLGGPRAAYRRINEALAAALRSSGIRAELAPPDTVVPRLDAGVCFSAPVAHEVAVAGKKLVGSAQVRVGSSLLQHGSIPLEPPTVMFQCVPTAGTSIAQARQATLPPTPGDRTVVSASTKPPRRSLSRSVGFARMAEAVEEALAEALGGHRTQGSLREAEREEARRLDRHYRSREWTWRR